MPRRDPRFYFYTFSEYQFTAQLCSEFQGYNREGSVFQNLLFCMII